MVYCLGLASFNDLTFLRLKNIRKATHQLLAGKEGGWVVFLFGGFFRN